MTMNSALWLARAISHENFLPITIKALAHGDSFQCTRENFEHYVSGALTVKLAFGDMNINVSSPGAIVFLPDTTPNSLTLHSSHLTLDRRLYGDLTGDNLEFIVNIARDIKDAYGSELFGDSVYHHFARLSHSALPVSVEVDTMDGSLMTFTSELS